jgi:type VI secretion system protein ImpF
MRGESNCIPRAIQRRAVDAGGSMADLTPQERLQPSLLDRLTDENPHGGVESRDQRLLSWQRLRDAVRRDLAWLLNCVHLEAIQDLTSAPLAARSTINYGLPETTGVPVANINVETLQKRVRQAILDYEPRLLRSKLSVTIEKQPASMQRNSLVFIIRAEMWAQPTPQSIFMRTEFDLETGAVRVEEGAH